MWTYEIKYVHNKEATKASHVEPVQASEPESEYGRGDEPWAGLTTKIAAILDDHT